MSWSVKVWKDPNIVLKQTIKLRQLREYFKNRCHGNISKIPVLPHIINYSMIINMATKQRIERMEIKRG